MSEIRLIHGDAPDVLRGLLDASVDAVVTDPPYELGFMGKAWDASGVAFRADLWREVLRVANPGAHLLAFGGARTYHRMACAIEDAGWEVRDSIHWLYGSGFPKSLNIGAGRGTALKPAHEPIIMARKPFRGTVAANVAAHGTGALNVDACRLPVCESTKRPSGVNVSVYGRDDRQGMERGSDSGRWPPNVLFSHAPGCNGVCVTDCPVAALDAQAGERTSGANPTRRSSDKFRGVYHDFAGQAECEPARGADSGVASRFFPVFSPDPDAPFLYCPKASRSERSNGLDNQEIILIQLHRKEGATWVSEAPEVRLRVDTALSAPRVIGVYGTQTSDVSAWNTFLFGSEQTALFPRECRYTTGTKTSSTTESKTLNWLIRSLTSGSIAAVNCATGNGGSLAESAQRCSPSLSFTSERPVFLPGVGVVASGTQWTISGNAGPPASHPTVKPVALMQWLVRLVTPPGGTVLDCFAGSGTTGIACLREGRGFLGIEREAEYIEIARARIAAEAPLFSEAI